MTATERVFLWSDGTSRLQDDGLGNPTLCVVFDGEGVYRGMFRVGKTTLQFASDRYDEPKITRTWRDATPLWNGFPKWVRTQVSDHLCLYPKF